MRFSRLEFDDKKDPNRGGRPDGGIRDEHFFYESAVKYYLHGDYELALRNFSRSLERNSTFFSAWLGQVLMLIELGEYPEALVWADKAMELFPEHPELLASKAVACLRDGKFDKALAYSDNSVSKENVTPRVWLARAEVMLKKKSPIAEDCLTKAVSVAGPDAPVIRLEAGRILVRAGKYSPALQYLNTSVDELPKSALAWYTLGCCQAKLGRSQASASLEQSLSLHPGWDHARRALNKHGRGFFEKLFGR